MVKTESGRDANKIIHDFYGRSLPPVSDDEAQKEIENLIRKRDEGLLDDLDEILASRLGLI